MSDELFDLGFLWCVRPRSTRVGVGHRKGAAQRASSGANRVFACLYRIELVFVMECGVGEGGRKSRERRFLIAIP